MNGTKSIRVAACLCVFGASGWADDVMAAPAAGITNDAPAAGQTSSIVRGPQQNISRLPPALRPKTDVGTAVPMGTGKDEPGTTPDAKTDLAALKASPQINSKPPVDIGGGPGSGEKGRLDALKELQKGTDASGQPEFGATTTAIPARAVGLPKGALVSMKSNGLLVSLPKFRANSLKGFDVWVAFGIYDNAATNSDAVARIGLLRGNGLRFEDTVFNNAVNLQVDTSRYKTMSTTVYLETWAKPAGSADSQWAYLNSLPMGGAQITNGKTTAFTPYAVGYLAGRKFEFKDAGFGTAQTLSYTFDYNSRSDCLEFEATSMGVGTGISFFSTHRGCAVLEGDKMGLHSDTVERQTGKSATNTWIWYDTFRVSTVDLLVFNPWPNYAPGKWMRLGGRVN